MTPGTAAVEDTERASPTLKQGLFLSSLLAEL